MTGLWGSRFRVQDPGLRIGGFGLKGERFRFGGEDWVGEDHGSFRWWFHIYGAVAQIGLNRRNRRNAGEVFGEHRGLFTRGPLHVRNASCLTLDVCPDACRQVERNACGRSWSGGRRTGGEVRWRRGMERRRKDCWWIGGAAVLAGPQGEGRKERLTTPAPCLIPSGRPQHRSCGGTARSLRGIRRRWPPTARGHGGRRDLADGRDELAQRNSGIRSDNSRSRSYTSVLVLLSFIGGPVHEVNSPCFAGIARSRLRGRAAREPASRCASPLLRRR